MINLGQKVVKRLQLDKSGNVFEDFIQPSFTVSAVDSEVVTVSNDDTGETYQYDHSGYSINAPFWDHEVKGSGGNSVIKTYIISRIFPVEA